MDECPHIPPLGLIWGPFFFALAPCITIELSVSLQKSMFYAR